MHPRLRRPLSRLLLFLYGQMLVASILWMNISFVIFSSLEDFRWKSDIPRVATLRLILRLLATSHYTMPPRSTGWGSGGVNALLDFFFTYLTRGLISLHATAACLYQEVCFIPGPCYFFHKHDLRKGKWGYNEWDLMRG